MAETSGNGSAGSSGQEAVRKRRQRFRIFGIAVLTCAVGGGIYWLLTKDREATDDAFLEADMVQIAPQVGGVIAELNFTDNQRADRGQLLIAIDPRDYEVQLASAKANLDIALALQQAAEADLSLTKATTVASIDEIRNLVEQTRHQVSEARQQADAAQADAVRTAADVKRYDDLLQGAVASRQRYEQAVADARAGTARWRAAQLAATAVEAQQAQAQARLQDALAAPQRVAQKEAQLANAKAQVEQARANLRAAANNLSYARITAPQGGRMTKRTVNLGDVVQKNQILAALVVDPPWVIANFKETQLTRMRPGQPVSISVDAFPGHAFRGHVDSIQAGTGARFSLLPPENATGNYVKVVQRIPVKIVFDDLADDMLHLLAPGMSVVPAVDVGAPPAAPKR